MKKILAVLLCSSMMLTMTSCIAFNGLPEETDENTTERTHQSTDITRGEIDPDYDGIVFETKDIYGNRYDESIFAGHKVTMINLWEPWCGYCVDEMPDLQRLYENYSSQGFQIIGMYSDTSSVYDTDDILRNLNITYPIMLYSRDLDEYYTGSYPTSFFVDENGHVLTTSSGEKVILGIKSYEGWESVIKDLMK